MKHKWIMGLAIAALLAVALAGTPVNAGTVTKTVSEDYGTVTYKFTIDTDSNEAIGHWHKSGEAIKTAWVPVPVGTDFTIWTETRDIDSSATTWTADTINLALETAPLGGQAIDSVGVATHRQKASIMWNLASGLSFTKMTSQQFFPAGVYADTIFTTADLAAAAKDTIDVGATSQKTFAFGDLQGASVPLQNLGYLRFSLCLDAADSLADGLIRFNVFIIFKNPKPSSSSFRFLHNITPSTPGALGSLYWSSCEPGHPYGIPGKAHRIYLAPASRFD